MNIRSAAAISLLSVGGILASCHNAGGTGPTVSAADNPWYVAASTGAQADLDAALQSGSSVNVQERQDRYSPLHVAAMAGNMNAVKFILANGGNVDGLDEDGRTPLMMALYRSQGQTSIALIDANANLEIRDRTGKTALMFAAQGGQVDAIHAMVKRQVNLDAQSDSGATALIYAADRGQFEAAKALKSLGANTALRDHRGRTARDFALAKRQPAIAELLRTE